MEIRWKTVLPFVFPHDVYTLLPVYTHALWRAIGGIAFVLHLCFHRQPLRWRGKAPRRDAILRDDLGATNVTTNPNHRR
jgi:hypothetical protein